MHFARLVAPPGQSPFAGCSQKANQGPLPGGESTEVDSQRPGCARTIPRRLYGNLPLPIRS